MTTLSSVAQSERYNAFSIARPISVALAFFLIVVVLRSIDLFVLKLDELPDPIVVSRVLGFLFVLGYLCVLRSLLPSADWSSSICTTGQIASGQQCLRI